MSATTPRRIGIPSTSNTPSKSSTRRVLGDLTPKAINSPSKQRLAFEQAESARAHSPLKQMQTMSPHMLKNKENSSRTGSSQAGRKRSIHEVEDVENVGNATRPYGARDMRWERPHAPITTGNLGSLPNYGNTFIEPQTPTEPNTSSPEPEPEVINNSQTSNQSFSELINYDCCATQPSTQQSLAPIPEVRAEIKVEEKPSKADILRARFGMGMYKLKTNQVKKSSSDVISDWEITSMTFNNSTTTANSSYQSLPSITLSPVRHEQAIQSDAQLTRAIPKLSGGPVLLPTAYSARMIHEYQMPSSPPQSISPQQLMSPVRIGPQPHGHGTPSERQEQYSDDEEGDFTGNQKTQRQVDRSFGSNDSMGNIVKGDAARRLMSLGKNMR
ncbi:hypothetical protein B0J11DRAFT_177002 [Dendryphion nanum]|uniref:Uncharacterized protein n=1 Tax=Dendryphion nanum TaxID=256645 RepID=A0A9P9EE73_9PLEO|nr:hypothetical protein B0J11DRAFT_177002 [Dendryphion nanum]